MINQIIQWIEEFFALYGINYYAGWGTIVFLLLYAVGWGLSRRNQNVDTDPRETMMAEGTGDENETRDDSEPTTETIDAIVIRNTTFIGAEGCGVGLRVQRATTGTMLFFADEQDFSTADMLELALLGPGDQIEIRYLPLDEDDLEAHRGIYTIHTWTTKKLAG